MRCAIIALLLTCAFWSSADAAKDCSRYDKIQEALVADGGKVPVAQGAIYKGLSTVEIWINRHLATWSAVTRTRSMGCVVMEGDSFVLVNDGPTDDQGRKLVATAKEGNGDKSLELWLNSVTMKWTVTTMGDDGRQSYMEGSDFLQRSRQENGQGN